MSFKISQDTWLVTLHARVRGVETHSVAIRSEREGERVEKERNVTQIVENVSECESGKALVSRLRHIVTKGTTFTPIGTLTNGARKDELIKAFEEARKEVDEHNAKLTSSHVVEFEKFVLPIGVILDGETTRALCKQVADALTEVLLALKIGDYERARAWVNRNKNLDALMPLMIGEVVKMCVEEARSSATKLRKAIDGGELPETAGAKLDLEVFSTALGMIGNGPATESEAA